MQRVAEVAEGLGEFRAGLEGGVRLGGTEVGEAAAEGLELLLQQRRVLAQPAVDGLAVLREGRAELGAEPAGLLLGGLAAEGELVLEGALGAFLQAFQRLEPRGQGGGGVAPGAGRADHQEHQQPHRRGRQHEDQDIHKPQRGRARARRQARPRARLRTSP